MRPRFGVSFFVRCTSCERKRPMLRSARSHRLCLSHSASNNRWRPQYVLSARSAGREDEGADAGAEG
jgi:hypothetical protein